MECRLHSHLAAALAKSGSTAVTGYVAPKGQPVLSMIKKREDDTLHSPDGIARFCQPTKIAL